MINLSGKYALPESMELKQAKITAVFAPRTMGVFILLIIILSFIAGAVRREMVLTLTGAVFLSIWIYCLAMTLLLALIHRRRAGRVSIHLSPERIAVDEWTQIIYAEDNQYGNGKKFQLPGILVRCRLLLSTRDGRRVTHNFMPVNKKTSQRETFQVDKRGAYFAPYDEFTILDILGFFCFTYRIPAENTVRLLVSPHAADEIIPVSAKGGQSCREGEALERTDELIDHRPYIPGDDPRRINWKLYSHGGELFIRQGEREPPPNSNLTILIDTQFDTLYGKPAESADAVDLLCENALAIINTIGKERDVQIGFTGQSEKTGKPLTKTELSFLLAYPAACAIQPLKQSHWLSLFTTPLFTTPLFATPQFATSNSINGDLPFVSDDRAVLILAMPRIMAEPCALDRFLSHNAGRIIELMFIYSAGDNSRAYIERAGAAEICAAHYNRRTGVRARAIGVH